MQFMCVLKMLQIYIPIKCKVYITRFDLILFGLFILFFQQYFSEKTYKKSYETNYERN